MIIKSHKIHKAFTFNLINVFFFINPFIISWGQIPSVDFLVMVIIFLIVIIVENFVLLYFNFNKYLEISSFIFNYLNFIFLLLPFSLKVNFLFFVNFLILVYFNVFKRQTSPISFYMLVFSVFMFAYKYNFHTKIPKAQERLINKQAKRNLYIIGIDGMVSEKFYIKFYDTAYSLAHRLRYEGFEVFDFYSPGKTTLQSYASAVSYIDSKDLNRSSWKKILSSKESTFYSESEKFGYKKQFVYFDNYFGINAKGPFDLFYPDSISLFSFYNYVNINWAYPLHRLASRPDISSIDQFANLIEQLNKIDLRAKKWISISHIWFPGHTKLMYDCKNKNEFESFRTYYINAQSKLIDELITLKNFIMQKDSDAVIVFWGDHGSYLLRRSQANIGLTENVYVSENDLKDDSNSVLIAVYPKNIGENIYEALVEPHLLFKSILDISN